MKTTTRKTQAKFLSYTSVPASLARAVIRQSGGWERFQEMAPDVANHGAAGGFSGWIYYRETEPFTKRNRASIAQMAEEQARDFGQGVLEMIQGFNCFRGQAIEQGEVARAIYSTAGDDSDGIRNALAWYALEETARSFQDWTEND